MDTDYRYYGDGAATPDRTVTRSYWIMSSLLLLWGLGYAALIFEAFVALRHEDFEKLVSAGMILPGYEDYVHHLPAWIIGLTVFKGATRVAGAIGLLLRRRWAVSMYGFSLAATCLIFFRGFLMDNRAAVEAPTQIGLDVLFFSLGIYALYFAVAARFRGTLR
jgi:hypothetical protein